MSRETQLEKLVVTLEARTAKYEAQLAKAKSSANNWGKDTQQHISRISTAFAGLAVGGVAGLAAIYVKSANAADTLGKLADQLGETPVKIQGLQRAADLGGVSVDLLNTSLAKMSKNLGEATLGTGKTAEWLDRLGLNTQQFLSLSPADQFGQIADKINGLSSQQEKAAVTSAIFGKGGMALVNVLAEGSAGLNAITQEVKDYGLELTRIDIAKIEAANDAWDRSTSVMDSFGQQLAVEISPVVEALANQFLAAAKEAGGLGVVASKIVGAMATGFGAIGDTFRGLETIWNSVKLVFSGVSNTILNFFVNVVDAGTKFNTGFDNMALSAIGAVKEIVNGMASADAAVSGFLDSLPYVSAKPSQMLQNLAASLDKTYSDFETSIKDNVNNKPAYLLNAISEGQKSTYDQISKDLEANLLTPMPSAKIDEWINDVQRKAQSAAETVAADKKNHIAIPVDIELDTNEVIAEQKKLIAQIAQIETATQSLSERENATYKKNLSDLDKFNTSGLDKSGRYNALLEAEHKRHAQALIDIDTKAYSKRDKMADDLLEELLDEEKDFADQLKNVLGQNDPKYRAKTQHEDNLAILNDPRTAEKLGESGTQKAIKDENKQFKGDPADSLKTFELLMDDYQSVSDNTAKYIDATFTSAFESITNAMSDMLARALIEGGNVREMFAQIAKAIAIDVVSGLIKVGIQMAINKMFAKASQTEDVASAAVAGPAIALAYAPAAAAVSLATLGANSVPAAAGISATYSLTSGLALSGMAHDGIDNIPKEGTWLLDKGERVLSRGQNDEIVKAVKNGTGGSVQVTNVFQISAGVAGTVQSEIAKLIPAIQKMTKSSVEQAIRSGGSMSRAVGAR